MTIPVAIDITQYPSLHRMYEMNKEEFSKNLKAILTHLDKASKERFQVSKEAYNMDYISFLEEVMSTFFDFEGIANVHENDAEKVGLRSLGSDIHPLSVFVKEGLTFDARGNKVNSRAVHEEFNMKEYLLSLFYGARFVSWQELASYLNLQHYELVETLKAQNFKQLAPIQPALDYQERNGIPVGKLIKGLGLFDCGEVEEIEHCLACEGELKETKGVMFCFDCRAGFKKLKGD